MSASFSEALETLPAVCWEAEEVSIRPIRNEDDLWYATFECRLAPGQEECVNPAGFSIGRAWMNPRDCLPCVICGRDGKRIGFILFLKWLGRGEESYSWSYYIDRDSQGQGYGRAAAKLAASLLKTLDPHKHIKLSAEQFNLRAQRLYRSIGFEKTDEMDGDDLVFIL